MANFGSPNFFDAGTNPPRSRVVSVGGERRIEKLPNGKTELWVNGAGVIVWLQILPPGQPPVQTTLDREYGVIRRKKGNWVRLNACPLEPRSLSTVGFSDFPRELQRPCADHNGKGACPHVRYLIDQRKANHAAARTASHALMKKRDTERREAEARREAQQQELNDAMLKLVERVAENGAQATPQTPAAAPASSRGRGGGNSGGGASG